MDHVLLMRAIRNFCYFLLGIALSAVSAISFAETIPATAGPSSTQHRCQAITNGAWGPFGPWSPTYDAACASIGGARTGQYGECWVGPNFVNCQSQNAPVYTCPTGQNWTLSGSNCTRPDCVAPQVRNPATGVCVAPKCTATSEVVGSTYGASGAMPYDACINGCKATHRDSARSKTDCKIISGVKACKTTYRYEMSGAGNSDECTPGQNGAVSPPADNSTTPESCGAGQGMIKIDGVTRCVNASTGQPVNTDPPKTETKTNSSSSVTNPDGSKTVTNVTNNVTTGGSTTVTNVYGSACLDPATCSPVSTVTSHTGGGAGGSGGGTGSGSGDGEGEGEGDKDHCEDDPDRAGCKKMQDLLGEAPESPTIPTEERQFSFIESSLFAGHSAQCPANPTFHVAILGRTIEGFDWGPLCDFATAIRPLVVGFAYLMAAMMIIRTYERK